ncbi:MAG: hypothetical protein ACP5N3_02005 [Candidatus Nanoarchaeia archaeon]
MNNISSKIKSFCMGSIILLHTFISGCQKQGEYVPLDNKLPYKQVIIHDFNRYFDLGDKYLDVSITLQKNEDIFRYYLILEDNKGDKIEAYMFYNARYSGVVRDKFYDEVSGNLQKYNNYDSLESVIRKAE